MPNGKEPNGKEPEDMDVENDELDDTQDLEVHQAICALREVQRDVNRTAAMVMGRMVRRFSPPRGIPAARKPPRP